MARSVNLHTAYSASRHGDAACGSTGAAFTGPLRDAVFFRMASYGSRACPRCARIAAKRNGGEPHHFLLAM